MRDHYEKYKKAVIFVCRNQIGRQIQEDIKKDKVFETEKRPPAE